MSAQETPAIDKHYEETVMTSSMPDSPRKKTLSIAVAAYNVEDYLAIGLESYCDPALEESLEVIIVNDGSVDETEEIALRYLERFPTIFKLINKENGGHGSAINAGLKHATGKYFRIIDGDDWANTEDLVKLVALLKDIESDLVIDIKREVQMGTGKSQLFPLPEDIPRATPIPFEELCNRADIESFFMIHTLSVRTDYLKSHDIQLLEHTFYVDYEFIVKASACANSITFLDLEVCQYLVGNINQSVSPDNYVKRFDDHSRVTEELLDYVSKQSTSTTRKDYLDSRVNLLINTHYNIALIFDSDRRRGLKRAKEFRAWLKEKYPLNYEATEKRYRQARILHSLGFNAKRLDSFMGRH